MMSTSSPLSLLMSPMVSASLRRPVNGAERIGSRAMRSARAVGMVRSVERVERGSATVLVDAVERRRSATARLGDISEEIAEAAAAMAARFSAGDILRPAGHGVSAVDAAHVAVEFIHPVIVGKRALPALVLTAEQADDLDRGSIVLGLALGPDEPLATLLGHARAAGCLTVGLTTDAACAAAAEHTLPIDADDPLVARELVVTTYHLLWELVHEHLDATNATDDDAPDDLGGLYPFLYRRDQQPSDLSHLVASTAPKLSRDRHPPTGGARRPRPHARHRGRSHPGVSRPGRHGLDVRERWEQHRRPGRRAAPGRSRWTWPTGAGPCPHRRHRHDHRPVERRQLRRRVRTDAPVARPSRRRRGRHVDERRFGERARRPRCAATTSDITTIGFAGYDGGADGRTRRDRPSAGRAVRRRCTGSRRRRRRWPTC